MFFSVLIKEIYITIVVSSATALAGIGIGFPAQVIPDLQKSNDIPIDERGLYWIATTGLIFRPVGAVVELLLINLVGRRTMLRAMAFTSVTGWIIVTFSTTELILCVGRAVTSLSIGMVAVPLMYIAEMSELHHRALLLQISCSAISLGTEVIYVLNILFHWRISSTIISVYTVMFLLSLYTIPESCEWYILKNRIPEAKVSYKWAKNCDDELAEEKIQEIINSGLNDNDKNKESFLKNLKKSNIYKPMILLVILNLFGGGLRAEVFSGYAVQMIFQLQTPYDSYTVVVLFGFINLLFSFFACYLVHKFKRRVLLMSLSSIMILSLVYVIVNELLKKSTFFILFPSIEMCFFILYMLLSAVIQQICCCIIPELIPLNFRGPMLGIVAIFMFFVVTLYVHLYGKYGVQISFTWILCFAALNGVLFFIVVLFFLPETKNKTLNEIGKNFSKPADTTKSSQIEMQICVSESVD